MGEWMRPAGRGFERDATLHWRLAVQWHDHSPDHWERFGRGQTEILLGQLLDNTDTIDLSACTCTAASRRSEAKEHRLP